MADVWISRKRWTCKYCNVTINDDIPSRRQHEGGLRHKNNVERALKGFYRKGEQEKKEADLAKQEMDKIERQALASYALDQAAATASSSALPPSLSAAPQPSASAPSEAEAGAAGATAAEGSGKAAEWKPADKLAAYSTAESLGYTEDPEVLRRQQEQEQRKEQGFVGQWEAVALPPDAASVAGVSGSSATHADSAYAALPLSEKHEARAFKLKERSAPEYGDEDDEDDGFANIKVKKRIKVETSQDRARKEDEARARLLPHWTPVRLDARKKDKPSDTVVEAGTAPSAAAKIEEQEHRVPSTPPNKPHPDGGSGEAATTSAAVKADRDEALPSSTASIKTEGSAAATADRADTKVDSPPQPSPAGDGTAGGGGGLFKKRRAGAGAGAKRVRALV
ncbi:hypothetical protein ACQY0O_006415 [Thecaphora frezii]